MYTKEVLLTKSREELVKICKKYRVYHSADLENNELVSNILKYFRRQSTFFAPTEEIDRLVSQTDEDNPLQHKSLFSGSMIPTNSKPPLLPITGKMAKRRSVYIKQQQQEEDDDEEQQKLKEVSMSIDTEKYKNTGKLLSDPDKRSIIQNIVNKNKLIQTHLSNSFNQSIGKQVTKREEEEEIKKEEESNNDKLNDLVNNNNLLSSTFLNNIGSTTPSKSFLSTPFSKTLSCSNLSEFLSTSLKPSETLNNSFGHETNSNHSTPPFSLSDFTSVAVNSPMETTPPLLSQGSLLNLEKSLNILNLASSPLQPTSSILPSYFSEINNNSNSSLDITCNNTSGNDMKVDDLSNPINLTSFIGGEQPQSNESLPVPNNPPFKPPAATLDPRGDKKEAKKRLSIIKLKEIANQKKHSVLSENKYTESSRPLPKLNPHVKKEMMKKSSKPDFDKIHNDNFNKMESIQDYEAKRKDLWSKLGFGELQTFVNNNNNVNSNKAFGGNEATTSVQQPQQSLLSNWLSTVTTGNNNSSSQTKTPTKTKTAITSSGNNIVPAKSPAKSTTTTPKKSDLSKTISATTPSKSLAPITPIKSTLAPVTPNKQSGPSVPSTPLASSNNIIPTPINIIEPIQPVLMDSQPETQPTITPTPNLLPTKEINPTKETLLNTTATVNKPSSTTTAKAKPAIPITTSKPKPMPAKTKPLAPLVSKPTTTTTPVTTSSSSGYIPSYMKPTLSSTMMTKQISKPLASVSNANKLTSTLSKPILKSSTGMPATSTTLLPPTKPISPPTEVLTNITNTPPKDQQNKKDESMNIDSAPPTSSILVNNNGKPSQLKKRKSIKLTTTVISGLEKRTQQVKKRSSIAKEKLINQRRMELSQKQKI